jgi:hypothetical protein
MKGITTLCGSVRFKDDFDKMAEKLTLAGWIVLMPNVWGQHERLHTKEGEKDKANLDKLHFDKILMSDSIVVINSQEYVGDSTRKEILFALDNHKNVFWLNGSTTHSWVNML